MRFFKIFLSILFAFLLSINANAETIIFPAGVYEGEIDSKGRAHGKGLFRFNINHVKKKVNFLGQDIEKELTIDKAEGKEIKLDDVVYVGNFHKNKIHKKGKLIGNFGKEDIIIYEGDTRYGRFNTYPKDAKSVRINNILKLETGIETKLEMKVDNKWYEAQEVNGAYQLTSQGQMALEKDKQGAGGGGSSGGDCGG